MDAATQVHLAGPPTDGIRTDMPDVSQPAGAPPLLSVRVSSLQDLQRCYLPFLRNGGLFIPCEHAYQLRQRVFLILKLPAPVGSADSGTTHALTTTVAWLTPPEAQDGKGMGVGLHFDLGEPRADPSGQDVKTCIESLLRALV